MVTITRQFQITSKRALSCLLISIALLSPAKAGEQVTVRLQSGRSFTAEVDAKTDDQRLWLRFGGASTVLLRPIAWNRVVSASLNGKSLTREQLRMQSDELKSKTAPLQAPVNNPPANELGVSELSIAQKAQLALDAAPQVVSVMFDASLANWDGDVETDGLMLQLLPFSTTGRPSQVGGTLEVELFALKSNKASQVRSGLPAKIGRWSVSITPEQIGPNGLTVKLPFQADHPEFNQNLAGFGLVHVRFVVPGHGVFEQSLDAVRIRPFAPLRDSLERSTGKRFLSTERTGRGVR